MLANTSSSQNVQAEDTPLLERIMQPEPLVDIDHEPANTPDLSQPAGTFGLELDVPPPSAEQQWGSTDEQAWSEHSARAWALAHVIHRIRSTPLPPILLPEQRRRFQQVVQMAAALMEEWQQRERDQAQQLANARPLAEPPMEPGEMSENHAGNLRNPEECHTSELHREPEATLGDQMVSDPSPKSLEAQTASQRNKT